MYGLLDAFKKKGRKSGFTSEGTSLRNLIGQVQLRHITSTAMKELLDANNDRAIAQSKEQYVVLYRTRANTEHYRKAAAKLEGNPRLTPIQALNIQMNLQLLDFEAARKEKDDDDLD